MYMESLGHMTQTLKKAGDWCRHDDFADVIKHKPRKKVLKNVYPAPIKTVYYFQEELPLYHALRTIK